MCAKYLNMYDLVWFLKWPSTGNIITTSILQRRKLGPREVKELPSVTQMSGVSAIKVQARERQYVQLK